MNATINSTEALTDKERDLMENGFEVGDIVDLLPAFPFQANGYPCKAVVIGAKTGKSFWPRKRVVTLLTEHGKIIVNIDWFYQLTYITFLRKWEKSYRLDSYDKLVKDHKAGYFKSAFV